MAEVVGQQVVERGVHVLAPVAAERLAPVRVALHGQLVVDAVQAREAGGGLAGAERAELREADRVVAPAAAELGRHQPLVHLRVAEVVPDHACRVGVELPRQAGLLV